MSYITSNGCITKHDLDDVLAETKSHKTPASRRWFCSSRYISKTTLKDRYRMKVSQKCSILSLKFNHHRPCTEWSSYCTAHKRSNADQYSESRRYVIQRSTFDAEEGLKLPCSCERRGIIFTYAVVLDLVSIHWWKTTLFECLEVIRYIMRPWICSGKSTKYKAQVMIYQ